jgi:hypothetical protein
VVLSDIHGASEAAVHEQSRDAFTATLPVPPAAGSSGVLFVTEISHLSLVGPTKVVLADPQATAVITTAAQTA